MKNTVVIIGISRDKKVFPSRSIHNQRDKTEYPKSELLIWLCICVVLLVLAGCFHKEKKEVDVPPQELPNVPTYKTPETGKQVIPPAQIFDCSRIITGLGRAEEECTRSAFDFYTNQSYITLIKESKAMKEIKQFLNTNGHVFDEGMIKYDPLIRLYGDKDRFATELKSGYGVEVTIPVNITLKKFDTSALGVIYLTFYVKENKAELFDIEHLRALLESAQNDRRMADFITRTLKYEHRLTIDLSIFSGQLNIKAIKQNDMMNKLKYFMYSEDDILIPIREFPDALYLTNSLTYSYDPLVKKGTVVPCDDSFYSSCGGILTINPGWNSFSNNMETGFLDIGDCTDFDSNKLWKFDSDNKTFIRAKVTSKNPRFIKLDFGTGYLYKSNKTCTLYKMYTPSEYQATVQSLINISLKKGWNFVSGAALNSIYHKPLNPKNPFHSIPNKCETLSNPYIYNFSRDDFDPLLLPKKLEATLVLSDDGIPKEFTEIKWRSSFKDEGYFIKVKEDCNAPWW